VLVLAAKYKEYPGWGYRAAPVVKVAVTGQLADGQRVWFAVAATGKLQYDEPADLVGQVLDVKAKVSGESDDGELLFLNYVKVVNQAKYEVAGDDWDAECQAWLQGKAAMWGDEAA
jgi:hypothetical protein